MNKKITARIDKVISDRTEAKAALLKRIDQAKADAEKAAKAMEEAAGADNENGYIKAADKKRFCESVIESCEQRIEELKKSVSEQEYNALVNEIKAETQKAIDAAEKKAVSLIAELYKLASELDSEVKENNQALAKWANVNGLDAMTIDYTQMNSELLFLKNEMQKRKLNAFNNGKLDTIYEKVPAVDAYGNKASR